jgi:hypothetical protein
MTKATVLLPDIDRFIQFPGGMKSGWCLTAQDNTLIHQMIVATFIAEHDLIGKVYDLIYGDDVFFYAHANEDIFTPHFFTILGEFYSRYNLIFKGDLPTSFAIEDHDFLSKHFR